MNNNIAQEQNTDASLNALAAQRYLYTKAKRYLAVEAVLTIPIVIVLSLLVVWDQGYSVWLGMWSVSVAILQIVVLVPFSKSCKSKAAKIQELFDVQIFGLEWDSYACGSEPPHELIIEASAKLFKRQPNKVPLQNWYPQAVSMIPLHLARLVCQRMNCWWDYRLRQNYSTAMVVVFAFMAIVLFLLGLVNGLSIEKFLLVVLVPLLPVLLFVAKEYQSNVESSQRLERLHSHMSECWTKAVNGELSESDATQVSRRLQNEIYANRKNNPLIFDWVYRLLRDQQEAQMTRSVESLIEEISR